MMTGFRGVSARQRRVPKSGAQAVGVNAEQTLTCSPRKRVSAVLLGQAHRDDEPCECRSGTRRAHASARVRGASAVVTAW